MKSTVANLSSFAKTFALVCTLLVPAWAQEESIHAPPKTNVDAVYSNIPIEADAMKPDKAWQDAIADLVDSRRYPNGTITDSIRGQRVTRCKELAKDDHPKLIRQAIVYAVTQKPRAEEDSVLAVIGLLGWTNDRDLLTLSIIPFLGSENAVVQKYVGLIEGMIESKAASPSIRAYGGFFAFYEMSKYPQPRELIVSLTHRNPSETLLTLDSALRTNPDERRQLRWTEHVVSDFIWRKENAHLSGDAEQILAREQLTNLLKDPRWWARLYVVEILSKYPELRSPDSLKALGQDDDPAIKEIFSKWKP